MRLVVFCEGCNYEYQVIAYRPQELGDGLSKCPKCKERNRIAFLLREPQMATA